MLVSKIIFYPYVVEEEVKEVKDEVFEYATEPKLFGKWSYENIECKDISLNKYLQVRHVKAQVFIPHTAGKYQKKRFQKVHCPIIERFTNGLMMHGRNNGKKQMAVRTVQQAFEIVHLLTGLNPVKVFMDAVANCGCREDSTRIGAGGVVRR